MKLSEVIRCLLLGDSEFVVCDSDTGEVIYDDAKCTSSEFSRFLLQEAPKYKVWSIEAKSRHLVIVYVER